MMTLKALLQKGTEILSENEIQEAGLDAWLLLEYVTGKSRAYYFAHSDEMVSEKETEEYFHLIGERGKHIPLQHLTHVAYFMGFEFKVDENVLIPRQDTETLVETALKLSKGKKKQKLLDMCTGSGCIAISLALILNPEVCIGTDISEKALKIAKANGENLAPMVKFIQSDLFENVTGSYDLIISNPPYITTEECGKLMPEVKDHEPMLALDGKEDGLYFYKKIIKEAKNYLNPDGMLAFEIGYDQGEAVKNLMEAQDFSCVEIKKDLAGLDRLVFGFAREGE